MKKRGINFDLSNVPIKEYGLVDPIPSYWPTSMECDLCPEGCYELIGYMVTNGILRAFIGCNTGGKIELDQERIDREMKEG